MVILRSLFTQISSRLSEINRFVLKPPTSFKRGYKKNAIHRCTVELQWLEHLSDHENLFKTGVFRANECQS